MTSELTIRQARNADAQPVADLLAQLGYPDTTEAIRSRLHLLSASSTSRILVAEHHGLIIGLAGIHLIPLLHAAGSTGRIIALVVSHAHQNKGIGSRLLAEAEAWGWANGCIKVEVVSADQHAPAHGFYESRGYVADERRFLKRREEAGH